jgi:hypothetical protein
MFCFSFSFDLLLFFQNKIKNINIYIYMGMKVSWMVKQVASSIVCGKLHDFLTVDRNTINSPHCFLLDLKW